MNSEEGFFFCFCFVFALFCFVFHMFVLAKGFLIVTIVTSLIEIDSENASAMVTNYFNIDCINQTPCCLRTILLNWSVESF